jgi:nucleoid DNA-binding protein
MASRISALNHYRPQIEYGETADWREVADHIARHTGISPVDVIRVLLELQAAIIHFLLSGRGVKLEGLGTYLPNINYKGVFDVAHRLDRRLKKALNIKGEFDGRIRNKKNIGMTAEEVYARWNREHTEDPVK